MVFKPNTTYREFEVFFLSALENNSISELRDNLNIFTKNHREHYSAWLFLAKSEEQLGNIREADSAYQHVLILLNPNRVGLWINRLIKEIKVFADNHNSDELKSLLKKFSDKVEKTQIPIVQSSLEIIGGKIIASQDSGKSWEQANSLVKEGNHLFTDGKHNEALEKLLKAESIIPEPTPQLFISMGNTALGIKDLKYGNKIALESALKGLKCKTVTTADASGVRTKGRRS